MGKQLGSKELTDDQRLAVYHALLTKFENGKLLRGAKTEISLSFSISVPTVTSIWERGKDAPNPLVVAMAIKNRKKGNNGRKCIPTETIEAAFRASPVKARRTYRSTEFATGISMSVLGRALKAKKIRRVSSTVKAWLNFENKKKRVAWALSHIDPDTKIFNDMYDYVHVDEKWFYMCEATGTYYLANDEPEPERQVKSKRFIPKVMFLAAVACPRYNEAGECTFDGKIGLWPFTHLVEAQRDSRNRPAGTLEEKTCSVNRARKRYFRLFDDTGRAGRVRRYSFSKTMRLRTVR